jgi:glutamyl-tRNA(Gln) amidotransferase subunit D
MNNILKKEDVGKLLTIKILKDQSEIIYRGYLIEILKDSIKIKLKDNGYNIDVFFDNNTDIKIENEKIEFGKIPKINLKKDISLPIITYIGTGGTIGTHVDYNTGAVFMCRSPEEIISTTPELENIINIEKIQSPFLKPSEDIYYKDWQVLSKTVYENLTDNKIDGVIITHGTDTLSFTGSALSFMIENINKPVILVGAQRSPDRASFDGSLNLICAAHFIKEKLPGVYIVMHGSMDDDFCYVLKAVKSRKMHTSRRDAFKVINDLPVCKIFSTGKIEYINKEKIYLKEKVILKNDFEDKVVLLKIYPNSDPRVIDWYIEKGYKGIVLEGTGLGHAPLGLQENSFLPEDKQWLKYLKKAIDKGLFVLMSSQCLYGKVNDKVYSNLRYLEEIGVLYLDNHDMLPEVLQIKLSVALKRFEKKEDVINYLKKNICGEISKKETPDMYDL